MARTWVAQVNTGEAPLPAGEGYTGEEGTWWPEGGQG